MPCNVYVGQAIILLLKNGEVHTENTTEIGAAYTTPLSCFMLVFSDI